jgi:geranylgeranyl diphosphate synthase type I
MQISSKYSLLPSQDSLPGLHSSEELYRVSRLITQLTVQPDAALLQEMCVEHFAGGGKMIRSRLAMAVGECFGLSRAWVAPWAAAVELVHNATLVHDDIQDGDQTRRGRPTTWVTHGVGQAINLGDQMLMLPTQAIDQMDCAGDSKWLLAKVLSTRACATVKGQVADLAFTPETGWNWESYIQMVRGKTGQLLALPVEGSLLLAGYAPEEARRAADIFLSVGVMYQLQDDVLDIFGDKQREHSACDLYEGKVSALVLADGLLHPGRKEELVRLLQTPRKETPRDGVERTVERFRDGGALQLVLHRMREIRDTFLAQEWGPMETVASELLQATLRPIAGVWK